MIVTAPMTSGQRPGNGDVRSVISRTPVNSTTCTSVASFVLLNAASR